MAGMVGLEPTTNRLTVYCANQLRHIPITKVEKVINPKKLTVNSFSKKFCLIA